MEENKTFLQLKNINTSSGTYVMGVDTTDPMENAYVLGYWQEGVFTVILDKSEPSSVEFNEEVKNLAKYFNAKIYTEK